MYLKGIIKYLPRSNNQEIRTTISHYVNAGLKFLIKKPIMEPKIMEKNNTSNNIFLESINAQNRR